MTKEEKRKQGEIFKQADRIVMNNVYCCVSGVVTQVANVCFDEWCDAPAIFGERTTDEDGEEVLREPYEHWVVSEWFADRLKEKGCLIEPDFYGLRVWGRECTGQSISMDSVVGDIAKDFLRDVDQVELRLRNELANP